MNKITFDMDNKICAIKDVYVGTVFCYDGNWYMMTNEMSQNKRYTIAISLATGELVEFCDTDEVEVFNGILHINCRQDWNFENGV